MSRDTDELATSLKKEIDETIIPDDFSALFCGPVAPLLHESEDLDHNEQQRKASLSDIAAKFQQNRHDFSEEESEEIKDKLEYSGRRLGMDAGFFRNLDQEGDRRQSDSAGNAEVSEQYSDSEPQERPYGSGSSGSGGGIVDDRAVVLIGIVVLVLCIVGFVEICSVISDWTSNSKTPTIPNNSVQNQMSQDPS